MAKSPDSLLKHFSLIPDFRVAGRTDHKLFDILFIAVVGTPLRRVTDAAEGLEPDTRQFPFAIPNSVLPTNDPAVTKAASE